MIILIIFQENFHSSPLSNFLVAYLGNVYVNYCSSRTLINTLEMALTSVALLTYSRAIVNHQWINQVLYVAIIATR